VVVEGVRASIGSASHCDVRLPMEAAGPEHVRASLSGGQLRFEALLATPPVTLDGVPLAPGSAATGVELRFGQLLLRTRALSAATPAARGSRPSPRSSWLLGASACALLALFALALLRRGPPGEPPLDEQLELFSQLSPSCPRREPRQALAFAQQQQDLAETNQERMPFVVDEGVAAVDAFEMAAACFRAGGVASLAEQAAAAAQRLQRELEDDFRARRLRLSRMLLVEDRELARVDVAWLRALLRGRSNTYVSWLDGLALELGAQEAP
jgi:hypothetical protein